MIDNSAITRRSCLDSRATGFVPCDSGLPAHKSEPSALCSEDSNFACSWLRASTFPHPDSVWPVR